MILRNIISFLLNHEPVVIDFDQSHGLKPTTTVLQYLRNHTPLKGTKEGCAEGDCGACTVVLGEVSEGTMVYAAYDSCLLFLPRLHGKHLITVEGLAEGSELHPVQQAMIDHDGSQCGYCTPGFVMALLGLYKSPKPISREEVMDGLTGNLCRCTGYRPIVEAAEQACARKDPDGFTRREARACDQLQQILATHREVALETGTERYFKPVTLDKALAIRQAHEDILLINGASDIALLVTKKRWKLPAVLDLSEIGALNRIVKKEGGISIGSGVPLERIKSCVEEIFPALYRSLVVFGSRQIRMVATLGGNIGSASPIGDTLPALMAYQAVVSLKSTRGERQLPLSSFITGYRKTAIQADEIITAVFVPFPEKDTLVKWYKISKRKDLDIASVSAGFRLCLDAGDTVSEIRLIYGGMAEMTKRAEKTERFLQGKPWNEETIERAAGLIREDFMPISDARSGKEGRMIMAINLLRKLWMETTPVIQ